MIYSLNCIIHLMFRVTTTLLLATTAALLTACAGGPEALQRLGDLLQEGLDRNPVVVATPPKALRPRVAEVGDAFIYGRTTLHQVQRQRGSTTEWRVGENQSYSTGPHFFVPALSRQSAGRQMTSVIEGDPGQLWPLQPGKQVRFTEIRRVNLPFGLQQSGAVQWACEVVDARMSYVPAGDFETYHVTCDGRADSVWFPRERLSWDYAPALGHYVKRSWFSGSGRRDAVLAAALPGTLATPERLAAVLQRLAAQ